jgi:hypothetical protein
MASLSTSGPGSAALWCLPSFHAALQHVVVALAQQSFANASCNENGTSCSLAVGWIAVEYVMLPAQLVRGDK